MHAPLLVHSSTRIQWNNKKHSSATTDRDKRRSSGRNKRGKLNLNLHKEPSTSDDNYSPHPPSVLLMRCRCFRFFSSLHLRCSSSSTTTYFQLDYRRLRDVVARALQLLLGDSFMPEVRWAFKRRNYCFPPKRREKKTKETNTGKLKALENTRMANEGLHAVEIFCSLQQHLRPVQQHPGSIDSWRVLILLPCTLTATISA